MNMNSGDLKSVSHKLAGFVLDELHGSLNLHGGSLGKIPLALQYDRTDIIEELVEKSYLAKYKQHNYTFCTGVSGVNWSYVYLFKNEFIDLKTLEFLCSEDDAKIKDNCLKSLNVGNYDFLHGGIGLSWYILYRYRNSYKDSSDLIFFKAVVDKLMNLCSTSSSMIEQYDPLTSSLKAGTVNMGLSHGLPSILKYCIESFKSGILMDEHRTLGLKVLDFIMKNASPSESLSMFPNTVNLGFDNDYNSRLGWCYGDLSLSLIIYQAAVAFDLSKEKKISLDLVYNLALRREPADSRVFDSGFCHGSAGVLYLFYRIKKELNMEGLDDCIHFWLDQTMSYLKYDKEEFEIKFYDWQKKDYFGNNSLLEGSLGVSLILSSLVNKKYDWDSCFMINNFRE